jgi:hypothetical protein
MDDGLFNVSEEALSPPQTPRQPSPSDRALVDIGGFRIVNDATSQSVNVPEGAEFFYAFAEAGDSRLEIGGSAFFGGNAVVPATSVSSLVIFEDFPFGPYPLAPGQRINCYGAANTWCNFRFLGRRVREQ